MTTACHTAAPATLSCPALPRPTRPAGLIGRIVAILALGAQRRRLAELDDAALADIGLTRAEAEAEAGRPVWDVPTHWMR